MSSRVQKSFYATPTTTSKEWIHIDANDVVLGRLATLVASILRGKHKPTFTPSADAGDYVVITNAEKIRVTGNKETDKLYHRHSGYPGGLKTSSLKFLREKSPERIIEIAVKGMLPHNRLGRQLFTNLKVYAGESHPHQAQNPKTIEVK